VIKHSQLLPCALYIADVPVRATHHGSALIYRLFESYPANKLIIYESQLSKSNISSEPRLPGVSYYYLKPLLRRFFRTRLAVQARFLSLLLTPYYLRSIFKSIDRHQVECVVTVTNGSLWFLAFLYAKSRSIPLYLICHDDILRSTSSSLKRGLYFNRLSQAFNYSSTTFVVCDLMGKFYSRLFHKKTCTLWPSRSITCTPPSLRTYSQDIGERNRVTGYAGTINSVEYASMLKSLALVLDKLNIKIHIYGPHTASSLQALGLEGPNIVCRGNYNSDELIPILQQEVDILYVPVPFGNENKHLARYSFPSKLTEYTRVGVPLLVQAPEYSSLASWIRSNPRSAYWVNNLSLESLQDAVVSLLSKDDYYSFSKGALDAGNKCFNHESVTSTFYSVIASHSYQHIV
jgi:hypothetical protein